MRGLASGDFAGFRAMRGARAPAAALLFFLLPGCTFRSRPPLEPIHVSVWTMWTGAEEQNFLRVCRRYEELHPGIQIDNLGAVNDDNKTIRAIVAGVPPDLFTLSDNLYLGPMAANGALTCLDERFRRSGFNDKEFVPASLRLCRFDGRLYAMPFLIDDTALLWNKKLFREAGLNPEHPPQTIRELEDYSVRLTARKNGQITRLGFQPLTDENALNQVFGCRLYDAGARRVTPDEPANVAAMTWYSALLDKMGGYQEVNAFSSGFGQAQGANNPFFVGKVAMMFNGEWNPWWCHRYAPALEYGVAALPYPDGRPELARSTWLGGNMFCIPKGSHHPEQAWNFLVWMQSDEAQILFAGLMNNVPNRRSALHSPALRTGADYKSRFAVFLDLADSPNAGSFPAIPVANLYNSELNTARDLVLNGEKTPAKALADVRVRVQRELDRYR